MPNHKVGIPQEKLELLYLRKQLAPKRIAEIFKCDRMTISNRLREFKIPLRSPALARMRYKKFDFSQDLLEKAYMLGFRVGDLNVYQKSIFSETVVVRCHTTQNVQVRLMKKLFFKYGKVTISKGQGSTRINCYLNKSFDFLIPKFSKVPSWLSQNTQAGLAFVAGYTDAEGNFILNQNRARFKIDSYDIEILKWISKFLQSQGINVKLRIIGKLGDLRSNGSRFNHDLWRLNINDAISLMKFIMLIKPHSKHRTRLRHMQICESNIRQRIINKTIKYEIN